MADVNIVGRPELPDHVIHEIIRHIPTKVVVGMSFLSKQWKGVLSCLPTLDFDEGSGDDNKLEQHHKFVDILQRCLLACNNEEEKVVLENFRLRMTSYLFNRDDIAVSDWLSYSFERSVKKVDISLRVSESLREEQGWPKSFYYGLSRTNFVNAKSLTCLHLEYVRVGLECSRIGLEPLLPSLKEMSFKSVHFDEDALSYLIEECPVVEYVSLVSSALDGMTVRVSSSRLKSLEFKHCEVYIIHVHDADNLESVTVVSQEPQPLEGVILIKCFGLKYISVDAWRMTLFHVEGSHNVRGTINAPNLDYFSFEGYLKSKVYLTAPKLRYSRIVLRDIWGEESCSSFIFDDQQPWKHFPKLIDFLSEFGSSKVLTLFLRDFRALIFPQDLRKTLSSSILHSVANLEFWTSSVVSANARDREDLMQSLQWMAPLATDIKLVSNGGNLVLTVL